MLFQELLGRLSSKLKGIAYKIHKADPAFQPDDLYQEAATHLWMEYQQGKLSEKTDSYILQGAYFYLKSYTRATRDDMPSLSMNAPINDTGEELQDFILSPESLNAPEGSDLDLLMEQAFNSALDRKEKEVVFFYLQGWTTREISERLGVSHVSIVNMESRIREKCQKLKQIA
jgi:RNA polymerase sigma factor (sigma-70 family)